MNKKREELQEKFHNYFIYGKEKKYLQIAKKVIMNEYKIIKEYKKTKRNYVAKIEIDKKIYILKYPSNETIIPQRKLQTFFKKGEALTSYLNIKKLRENGVEEFTDILCVGIKRKILIEKSFIVMEYIEGENIQSEEDIDKILEVIKKIHNLGIYHGDLNTSNFIKSENKIKIIDTQAKREKIFFFKRAYDILTLEEDLLVIKLGYKVQEKYGNLKYYGYYLAKILKKIKKNNWVKKIRKFKSLLREKGIKI